MTSPERAKLLAAGSDEVKIFKALRELDDADFRVDADDFTLEDYRDVIAVVEEPTEDLIVTRFRFLLILKNHSEIF